jgi:general transcription factor 3C polypeptide 3 (transcription factor C subunit 4)
MIRRFQTTSSKCNSLTGGRSDDNEPDFGAFADIAVTSKDENRRDIPRGRGSRLPGGQPIPRGPRKPAELSPPIKKKMAEANEAYLKGNLKEARDLAWEIIRLNNEIFQAYTLLTTIYEQLHDYRAALETHWRSCFLRPKDPAIWIDCAERARQLGNMKREDECYRSAIRMQPSCVEARVGKAKILTRKGKHEMAIIEYKKILSKYSLHDPAIIRALAEAYLDNKDVENARGLYRDTFAYWRSNVDDSDYQITWDDVCAYIALYEVEGSDYEAALKELKSLARWLAGRESQEFFDDVANNDCEWDYDNTRRVELSCFQADEFEEEAYGASLPLELRVKMGIFRLRLGHSDEATVRILVCDQVNSC